MRVTVFAILFYVLTVSSASAGIAGSVWLDSCEKGESKKHKAWEYYLGLCRGNIEGAGGMYQALNQLALHFKIDGKYLPYPKTCRPKGVTVEQEIKMVKKWLDNHPDKLHERIELVYTWTMRESFPCK